MKINQSLLTRPSPANRIPGLESFRCRKHEQNHTFDGSVLSFLTAGDHNLFKPSLLHLFTPKSLVISIGPAKNFVRRMKMRFILYISWFNLSSAVIIYKPLSPSGSTQIIHFFPSDRIWCPPPFFPASWRYNWHTTLCKFKVYASIWILNS